MGKLQFVLDLTDSYTLPTSTLSHDLNLEYFTLNNAPDNNETRKKLYDLVRIGVLDIPDVKGDFETFPQFVDKIYYPCYWNNAESQFLAAINGEWIGLCSITVAVENSMAKCGLTSVKRNYRSLGIASELKRQSISYSLNHGLKKMVTMVHKDNAPMLAVNQRFGFRLQEQLEVQK